MKNYITNDAMMTNAINILMNEVLEVVTDKVYDELINSIDKIVYIDPPEPTEYKRLGMEGGFIGSWEKDIDSKRGRIISEIKQDPEKIVVDLDNNIHGSIYNGQVWNQIYKSLSDIFINGETGSPMWGRRFGDGWWREGRDFWTPFVEMLDSGKIDVIVASEFKKRGIKFS